MCRHGRRYRYRRRTDHLKNLPANFLDGGAGSDTADYSAETSNLYIDLSFASYVMTGPSSSVLNELYASIENATGGSGNDIILGSNGVDNRLAGGAGNDQLVGNGGNDLKPPARRHSNEF